MNPGSLVILHLVQPTEKFWGLLLRLGAEGVTVRGINLGSFDDWARGLARSEPLPPEIEQTLERVQSELFSVGAELATPQPEKHGLAIIGDPQIALLERAIDSLEAGLPPLRNFILPSGSRGGSLLHVARSICRRAERRVVTLADSPEADISLSIIRYLNRLGDYLFVAARFANIEARAAEVPWQLPKY